MELSARATARRAVSWWMLSWTHPRISRPVLNRDCRLTGGSLCLSSESADLGDRACRPILRFHLHVDWAHSTAAQPPAV